MPPLEHPDSKYWKKGEEVAYTTSMKEHGSLLLKGYEEVKLSFEQAINIPEYLKIMERRLGIMTEWDVKVCNNMKDFTWEINYDYYIGEAL